MLTCAGCGYAENESTDHFCNSCGVELREPEPVNSESHSEVLVSRTFAGVSDIGRVHARNEDAIAARLISVEGKTYQVMVLCDGVSTSFMPHLASRVGADTGLAEIVRQLEGGIAPPDAMKAGLHLARDAVAALPANSNEKRQNYKVPATTIVAAILGEDRHLDFGWLGDSRIYWLSRAGSMQLTRDDSWMNDSTAAQRSKMTAEEIRKNAHVISRCLGARMPGFTPHEPHVSACDLKDAGALLAVSDGFYGDAPLPEDMLGVMLSMGHGDVDALTLARNLVTYSNNAGGRDNISVVAMLLDALPPAPVSAL